MFHPAGWVVLQVTSIAVMLCIFVLSVGGAVNGVANMSKEQIHVNSFLRFSIVVAMMGSLNTPMCPSLLTAAT